MKKKNILVGVCGGISAYKTCYLVRLFKKKGFNIRVMMTPAAQEFIKPLVFQALSGERAYTDMFTLQEPDIEHISLAQWADLCVIAPASANTISKIAQGICDNLLTTVVCALESKTKVVFAAAMNVNMWQNPIIKENIRLLKKQKKYFFINPPKGELACGDYGEGRMAEPEQIYSFCKKILSA